MAEEKKISSEKDWWQSDRVDAAGWGLVFIWGALLLLAGITNVAES